MGALTVNRKRGFDHCTTPTNSIYSNNIHIINNNNSNNSNSHSSSSFKKRKKIKMSSDYITQDQIPIPSQQKVKSRLDRYPGPVKELKREVHAPCTTRGLFNKFASSSSSPRGDVVVDEERGNSHHYNIIINNNNNDKEQPICVDDIEMGDIQFVDVVSGNHNIAAAEFGCHMDRIIGDDDSDIATQSDEKDADSKLENNNNNNINTREGRQTEIETSWDMVSYNQKMRLLGRQPVYKELWKEAEDRYSATLSSLDFQIELNEKQRKKFPLLRHPLKQPVQEVVSEQVLREAFLPLSEEEKAEVSRAFSNSNRRKVLATHDNSNIAITGEILQCLRPKEWLNDEVINVYMELLKERERRDPKKYLNCHFFNTFFYKKLCSGQNRYDYKSVRRWTTQRKLGYALKDCDKIFVPIHRPYHWCLAIINKKDSKFQYLDSLGGTDSNVLKALARYYVEEVKDKSGENIDVSSWKQENVTDLPAQKNGFDCGVFMVKYTDFYSRGLGLCFKQDNMAYFRLRTAKEILRLRAE